MTQPPPHATVVQPGYPAHRRIVEAFGTEVLLENGNIDRKVLGDLIFNQPDRRHLLNTITHPEIRKEMMKETFKYFLRGKSRGLGQVRQSPLLPGPGPSSAAESLARDRGAGCPGCQVHTVPLHPPRRALCQPPRKGAHVPQHLKRLTIE